MQLLNQKLKTIEITNDVGDAFNHVLTSDMINAVNAAIAINRPLLIWGEPGIGKSQLAKAVAKELERPYISFVADARTESRDLLWAFDAVARLAEAQIHRSDDPPPKDSPNPMDVQNFIVPGPLWWALNWESAENVAKSSQHETPSITGRKIENGVVVLIDEIDKADTDVPNGLLEALGSSRFHPQGLDKPVECQEKRPLVIVTTNEERALPDAFLRRCLSLHLSFPKNQQEEFLVERALENKSYFENLDAEVFNEAATMLVQDRQHAIDNSLYPLPGQAEYFDMLRGVHQHSKDSGNPPMDYIEQLRQFVYKKHPGFHSEH